MFIAYALPPDQMTPVQRADEIVSILVRAILRMHAAADTGPSREAVSTWLFGRTAR